MAFALNLNIATSPLHYVCLDSKTLETRATSSGWNRFCEGLRSVEIADLVKPSELKIFQNWLKAQDNSAFDLWLNHPKDGRISQRCQKVIFDSNQIVLQLTPISDLQLEKKLLQLLAELTAIAERLHESPSVMHQRCIEFLVTSLRAEKGAFGHLQTTGPVCWLGCVGEPPALYSHETVSIHKEKSFSYPLRHEGKIIGVIYLDGLGPVLMSESAWLHIGRFFTTICLQAIRAIEGEQLREKLQRTQTLLEQTNTVGMIGGWEVDLEDQKVFWTDQTHHIHGTDPKSYVPSVKDAVSFYVEEHRERLEDLFTKLVQINKPFDENFQIKRLDGHIIWVRVVGKSQSQMGKTSRVFGIFQNIDETYRANLQVIEAKKTLELVQEASSDGFWDWDLKQNMVTYSARWKTMLGYGIDELPDGYETWKSLIHPDDFPNTQTTLDAHWSKRLPYGHTSRFKHKDGSWRTILVRAQTVRDENDVPIRVLGVHTDITDLTKLRKEAKDQAFKTNLVLSALGIGIWDWDVEKDRLNWDEQLFKLYQTDKEQFTHRFEDWRRTVDPISLPAAEKSVQETLDRGVIFDHVFRLKPEFGAKVVKGHGVILRDSKGKPKRLLGLNFDVTKESETQQELRVFQQLAEMSPDIVGLINRHGEVIFLNQAATNCGWECGVPAQQYFPAATVEVFTSTILPTLKKTGHWEGELVFRDLVKQEDFPVKQRAFLMRDELGKVQAIATVGVDLREKQRLEAEIERQRIQFINNSKMSALGEMASGMAHEINNPLAILKGGNAILRIQSEGNEVSADVIKSFLDKQDKTIDRIAQIISGLRNFARDHSQTDFVLFNLQEMVGQTLTFCQTRFKNNGVNFQVTLPTPSLLVRGRETQLSQALLNLLNNAFDAVVGIKDAQIEIITSVHGKRTKLSVVNNGPLISSDVRDRMMEPFYTTKEVGKGTGLGLPIAKGIVETHGGRLYLDGEASKTCFVIELPIEN